jgi:membrane associated rhomboid family serine protease
VTTRQPPSGPAGAGSADGTLGTPLGRAATLVVAWIAVLWVLVGIDQVLDHRLLVSYGIRPRDPGSLPDILTAPFLHAGVSHVAANSTGLLGLGLLAALTGVRRFLAVTLVIAVVSGIGVWLIAASGSVTVGASGLVFGYLGYLLLRGFTDRRPVDLLLSVGVALGYGYILLGVVAGGPGVSWQGHLFGLLGGLLAAWLFRRRRPAARRPAPENPPLPA